MEETYVPDANALLAFTWASGYFGMLGRKLLHSVKVGYCEMPRSDCSSVWRGHGTGPSLGLGGTGPSLGLGQGCRHVQAFLIRLQVSQ